MDFNPPETLESLERNVRKIENKLLTINFAEKLHEYLGICDVIIDCCHGFHPVAVNTLLILDWPLLTLGQKEEVYHQRHPETCQA